MYFRNEYAFLSNMYICPVTFDKEICGIKPDGFTYPSSEHLYQRLKIYDLDWIAFCKAGHSPKHINSKSRKYPIRQRWLSMREEVMFDILKIKFSQNPDLLIKLRGVQEEIIEHNTWNDKFWGVDVTSNTGLNRLGMMLMKIRDSDM